ncbi:MAG: excinuclease ABC subunit UvrC [Desulfobacteraceae bacterium]|nr:excinuclease ABC subunit UvrC [Desulfobacteraceae bacterium]
MNRTLQEKYSQSPHSPGVYLMKDAGGKIIYVGKAKDLKKRLASYFISKQDPGTKTAALIGMIDDFDLVITASDHEAFILESNLIKEHNPKYNVLLKDGKNYPLLRIDMNETYPGIQRVRKIKNDHAHYFGPYSSSLSVKRTLKQIQKIFKLRKCRNAQFKNRSRPCLNYQIKACLGVCCNEVAESEYKKQVKDAILFLRGKSRQVVKRLGDEMKAHADVQEFEKAAQVRDIVFAIKNIMEKQVVVCSDMEDRDVMGLAWDKTKAVVAVMMVRSGLLVDTVHYALDLGFKAPDEVLCAFVDQYYKKTQDVPAFVLLNQEIESKGEIGEYLSHRRGKKTVVHCPVRGDKKRLVNLAVVNASRELEKILLKEEEALASLVLLKTLMGMENLPQRIECFDNSNISGQDPVSSMVVFTNGRPDKSAYRKYIIRDIEFQDDYAYMYQVLQRRFSKTQAVWPDLLVVDGGKGQLGMAIAVLKDLGIDQSFALAGLAKKDKAKGEVFDKIYVPGRSNPLNTGQAQKALYLLQQVRDEAHRFAITFQRKRREKRGLVSILDSIPGIGPAKKKMLLIRFKGIENMKKTSLEELSSLPGITGKTAKILLDRLNG